MRVVATDVLIDHFHNVEQATNYIATAILEDGEIFVSAVSVAEIFAGMRAGELEDTEALLALFTVVAADGEIARIAGGYLNRFEKTHSIDLGDALIAATAKLLGAELVTRNVKHYPMDDIETRIPYVRGRKQPPVSS